MFFNNIISVGSSVLLLYADIGIHRDIKELNVFLTSIFSTVNFYTIYSSSKCDELGYSKDYKAADEEDIEDTSQDFHNIWTSYESNLINAPLDSLYDDRNEELYEEKI